MVFIGSGGLKEVLFIKIKYRHDGFADQFSRIFMTKMFIISAFVMSIDFFSDRVSCWVSEDSLSEEFVHSACWIQGFFIYEEMKNYTWLSGYYGMPKNVIYNGILDEDEHHVKLCSTPDNPLLKHIRNQVEPNRISDKCRPLTKIFYVQYQYLSFYVASLAVLYYIPYLIFRLLNADLISLKGSIKKEEVDKGNVSRITDNYFNYDSNGGVIILRLKILANLIIKLIYVFINIGGFLFTDRILNNNFMSYGYDWIQWARRHDAYDGFKTGAPRPGNVLLPTMGFCDLAEGAASRQMHRFNDYRLICEISTHILYQYVLLVLWFLFVAGIFISAMGLLLHIVINIFTTLSCAIIPRRNKKCAFYHACKKLTLREIEYIKYIRMKNLPLYNAILRNLLTETGV